MDTTLATTIIEEKTVHPQPSMTVMAPAQTKNVNTDANPQPWDDVRTFAPKRPMPWVKARVVKGREQAR
jgi:hypothetical protein